MPILDRFRIDDEAALVTGAGRGIGRANALALVECNAAVADNLEAFAARGMDEFGRIDIVIDNVGGSMPKGFLQTTEKRFAGALHLASPASAFVTGTVMEIHGGISSANLDLALAGR